MSTSYVERFFSIDKIIRSCSRVVGADVMTENYRISYLTTFVIVAICFFFGCTFYTLYVAIVTNNDWTEILQTLCMATSGVQGTCKLVNGISMQAQLRFLRSELYSIYDEYGKKHERYRMSLGRSINAATTLIKSVAVMYLATSGIIILMTVLLRLVWNRKEFVLQFRLPGVDPETEFGYITLNCVHILCLILGSFGNFAGDMYFFMFTTHVPLLKDILKCKLEDMNLMLQDHPGNKIESAEQLKDIFRWHQRYMIFLGLVKEIYFWVIVVEIGTIAIGMGCTLFCLLLGIWTAGYIYLAYCFVILYIYCGLGTLVDIANDGFVLSIYNDLAWYRLGISEQKMIQIMLRMTQNTTGLTVGAVMPLTMNTGLQVTKAIYTWSMMMINFIE